MCVPLHAQTPDYRFGKVSADELSMTSYDKDPEAEAVYLNEEGNLYYQIGSNITITRDYRARIKILKPEGSDQANISLTYIDNFNLRETYRRAVHFHQQAQRPVPCAARRIPAGINYGIRCTLELPEGYTVEEMPRNINLSVYDNGVSCRYVRNTSGQ